MIDTGTTVVTFLMVLLIQNTRNRDTQAARNELAAGMPDTGSPDA